jgi:hypothetical protein
MPDHCAAGRKKEMKTIPQTPCRKCGEMIPITLISGYCFSCLPHSQELATHYYDEKEKKIICSHRGPCAEEIHFL